ncbi:MAG: DNA translocase FtsK 4TM domain-containing protein [Acidobacteriota bacterium]
MARKRKRPDSQGRFREEAIGFLCLAAAIFLAVALISYNAADPNPFDLAADGTTRNWAGPVGATLAAATFQLLGLGAWLATVALCMVGINRIRGRKLESPFTKTLGTLVLTASVCGLATMGMGEINWGGGAFAAGGIIGSLTALALVSAFGPVGGPLVGLTAALLSIVAATRLSIESMLAAAWRGVVGAFRRARTSLAHRREQQRKAKARRNVIAKHTARSSAPADDEAADEAERQAAARALLKVKVPVTVSRPDGELPERMVAETDAPPPPIHRRPEPEAPTAPDPLPFEQPAGPNGSYALPDSELLEEPAPRLVVDESEFVEKAKAIASKGAEFKVTGEVVAIHPGPVVTTYEFKPSAGVKYSRILNLEEDLSLALKAESIRIARLPGKSTVGIEAPNSTRRIIRIRELFESKEFSRSRSKLTLAVGKEIHGENIVTDLARAPHLLIAGTTGSGKSVAMNAMLMSLLYKATPDEVKLVLVDPKRLEFGLYEDIPHLLTPVVVDPDRAANALGWAVREMEKRYRSLAEFGVRNIEQFNMMLQRGEEEMIARARKSRAAAGRSDELTSSELKPLPYVVVCIDELADLMMTSSAAVEACIMRLAQMARAVGIHLILATQRPSVDVITGTIKNNLPARISFRVASKTDSRVILDAHGAESLLGKGDMLFLAPGTSRLQRVHGAYVDEDEVRAVVDFWRNQARPQYQSDVTLPPPDDPKKKGGDEEAPADRDEYFEEALQLVLSAGEASISNIQRKLRLGYARAGRIVDMMEAEGLVGPPEGSKPRRLLVDAGYVAQKYGDMGAPPG